MSRTPPIVLVVDDSPDIHRLLVVQLRSEELVLEHAFDPTVGLRRALDSAPDLILLDVEMPGISGIELCRSLKSNSATANVPVIFLTAAGAVHDKIRGFDAGAVDYVTKPFDAAELRARVRAALRTKHYQDLLADCAQVDALTGLRNRRYFDQRLGEELAAMRRHGRPICLLMVDIDHFKRFNDAFGHPFGDRALQRVAGILGASVRPTDAACRYGGEEFAVILVESDIAAGRCVAERIGASIREIRFEKAGQEVAVTVSIGLASTAGCPASAPPTVSSLVSAADEALYAAKRDGRDRTCEASSAGSVREAR